MGRVVHKDGGVSRNVAEDIANCELRPTFVSLVDKSGIAPTFIGDLPEQCAALNRTNINVQLMTIEAARTLKKDAVYQAVMLDPHTCAELSIDDIVAMCDDLFEAHRGWMPEYH